MLSIEINSIAVLLIFIAVFLIILIIINTISLVSKHKDIPPQRERNPAPKFTFSKNKPEDSPKVKPNPVLHAEHFTETSHGKPFEVLHDRELKTYQPVDSYTEDDEKTVGVPLGGPIKHSANISGKNRSASATVIMDEKSAVMPQSHASISYWDGTTEITTKMTQDKLSIGRDTPNDISIPLDKYLGRNHAVLIWKDNCLYIRNIDAKNGTYINGTKVDQPTAILQPSKIQMGKTTFTIKPIIDEY